MVLATIIANEAQTLLGLHLDNIALAMYLTPFLLGSAAVLHKLLTVEVQKIGADFLRGFAEGVGPEHRPSPPVPTDRGQIEPGSSPPPPGSSPPPPPTP
jgi:hypothetical protein